MNKLILVKNKGCITKQTDGRKNKTILEYTKHLWEQQNYSRLSKNDKRSETKRYWKRIRGKANKNKTKLENAKSMLGSTKYNLQAPEWNLLASLQPWCLPGLLLHASYPSAARDEIGSTDDAPKYAKLMQYAIKDTYVECKHSVHF